MGQHLRAGPSLVTVLGPGSVPAPQVHRCLEAFGRMVTEGRFAAEEPRTGVELELALVDEDMDPAMLNHAVLDRSASDAAHHRSSDAGTSRSTCRRGCCPAPRPVTSRRTCSTRCRAPARAPAGSVRRRDDRHPADARRRAPRLRPAHRRPALRLLNRQMVTARGEPFRLDITEPPAAVAARRTARRPSTSCSTSTRSPPRRPARRCSCTSSSPPRPSRRTGTPRRPSPACRWRSRRTRRSCSATGSGPRRGCRCSTQAVDTRPVELRNQGVRPAGVVRRPLGPSAYDLFEENVRYFRRAAAPGRGRGPVHRARRRARTAACTSCACTSARCGAGTARCTTSPTGRAPAAGEPGPARRPHGGRRRRQRDVLLRARPRARGLRPPAVAPMSFDAAEANFTAGARHGIDAALYWPGDRHRAGRPARAAPHAAPGAGGPRGLGCRRGRTPTATCGDRARCCTGARAPRGRSGP